MEEEPRPETELWENLYKVCEDPQIAESYRRMIVDEAVAHATDPRRMLELLVWFMNDTVQEARDIVERTGCAADGVSHVTRRIDFLANHRTVEDLFRSLSRDQFKVVGD